MSNSIVSKPDGVGVEYIDSLDARLIQYQYAAYKIQNTIKAIKSLQEKATETKSLPLIHYILMLGGYLFAINENVFHEKLSKLASFTLFKQTSIVLASTLNHIPYDIQDQEVSPLSDLPEFNTAFECLKAYELLCVNCLQGYQKRIKIAVNEKKKIDNVETNYEDIENMLKNDIFNDDDFDLTLGDDLLFKLPNNEDLLNDANYVEASLIDIDISATLSICKHLRHSIDKYKSTLSKFKQFRSMPKSQVEEQLKKSKNWKLSLHKIFAITVRLNDLYHIFRKFGRNVYLSNDQHLHDQKLQFQSRNSNYFKLHLLSDIKDLFNNTKKNGTMIATLTRFIRQNSKHEVSTKNIIDFMNFANQGYSVVDNSITKFEEFGNYWVTCELRFRKTYSLPKSNLIILFQRIQDESPKNSISSNNISSSIKKTTIIPKLELSDQTAFPTVQNIQDNLKNVELNDLKKRTRTSRSSSVSSLNSNGSGNFKLVSPISPPSKNNALNSPGNRNSGIFLQRQVAPPNQRPNSIFLTSSGSYSSVSLQSTEKRVSTSTAGRRRSNSQPIRSTSYLTVPEKTNVTAPGAAAAAAALTKNSSPTRSPSVSRSPSVTKSPSTKSSDGKKAIPSPTPVNPRTIIIEEDIDTKKTALTANQRLQQHLRQASKSGTLFTQNKEIFTTVEFDPNSPSSVNLRKKTDSSSTSSPSSEEGPSQLPSEKPASSPKITRTFITRMNTRKNSITVNISDAESKKYEKESSSTDSMSTEISSAAIKKVRFSGVPEYTESEDAPTKYANRILKNFAVFKPSPVNTSFKKKDQMFKKEESMLFKSQLIQDGEESYIPPPLTKSSTSNRISKLKTRLV